MYLLMQNNESSYLLLLKMCACVCMYANLINSDDAWNKQTEGLSVFVCQICVFAYMSECVCMCEDVLVAYTHMRVCWQMSGSAGIVDVLFAFPFCFPLTHQHRADHIALSSLSYSYTILSRSEEKGSEHKKR